MPTDFLTPGPFLLLIGVGVLAGFANTVAGGGSLLTIPALIFLGLPETVANATSRLPVLFQSIAATARFHRAGRIQWRSCIRWGMWATIGAVLGAVAATRMDDSLFRTLFAWIMLVAAVLVVLDPSKRLAKSHLPRPLAAPWLAALLFCAGFYGGLVQAGVGYAFLAVLMFAARLPLLEANISKVVLVFLYTPLVLLVFGALAEIHLTAALSLSLGQGFGAWIGARAALSHGAPLIRWSLAIAVCITAVKLLGYF